MCTIVRKFSFVSYLTCLVTHRVASYFLESRRLPLERKSNKNETIILRLRPYPLNVAGRFRCCFLASYDLVLRVKYPLERVTEGFLANGRLVLVAGANHARPPRVLTSLQLAREKERRGGREREREKDRGCEAALVLPLSLSFICIVVVLLRLVCVGRLGERARLRVSAILRYNSEVFQSRISVAFLFRPVVPSSSFASTFSFALFVRLPLRSVRILRQKSIRHWRIARRRQRNNVKRQQINSS